MTNPEQEPPEPTNSKVNPERVLLIAADADETARVLGELDSVTEEKFQVEWVTELASGIERLGDGGVEAAVVDLNLPGSQGTESFDKVIQAAPNVPVLILSDSDTEATARQAVHQGAEDYLVKEQADGYRLRRTVRTMIDRRAAESVAVENEIASGTLDAIGAGILRTDLQGNVTYLNLRAEVLTGWAREEALGHPVSKVLRLIDSTSGAAILNTVEVVLQRDKSAVDTIYTLDCKMARRDGAKLDVENRVTMVNDQSGTVSGVVIMFRDVSLARAATIETSRLAQHDVLTGLPNRTLFNDRLAQAISLAQRQSRQLAVLFVDVDQFKRINDSLGHAVGDKLLRSIAGRLTACVRRTDTVCRLGGDEFVILLTGVVRAEDAAFSAGKILRAVAAPHIIDNKSIDINVSIGGSTYPVDGQDAESLLSQADAAMYEAKQRGRNGVEFFRGDMQVRIAKRLLLEGDLRYALGRNEFVLHYQPKIDLKTGQITGMEALLRWAHPARGMLLPMDFLPIAEECGLIVPIGQWVLLEACKQSRAWSDAGFGIIPLAVNVSASEFHAKDFLSGVRAVLIATGVEPFNLELELTETVLMEDAESAVVILQALKAMGVRLAMDDFGTGYSSFTYLRRFPMDTLKVDQSFVHEITTDPADITIVSAMINIGKSLNRRMVAEGVETRSQLDFLQLHACSEGQGLYFSPPLASEQAGSLFKDGLKQGLVH
jgi:diguanylate cyclase (GGDEF)-like protein/PAS domain S-box-containing protein